MTFRLQGTSLLRPGDVYLWRVDLRKQDVGALEAILAPEELARALRFQVEEALRQFVVVRGVLRQVLAGCLDTDPRQLVFGANEYGKPMLAGGSKDLEFNVSHAGDWGLIAVARGRRVGVDVERIRPEVIGERLAAHFFAPEEVAVLDALSPEIQAEAFFNGWTRKEAFVKAVGRGLSIPLDAFVVSLAPDVLPALLETRWDPAEAARWSLVSLPIVPGYVGALAVEGHGWTLHSWDGLPDAPA